MTPNTVFVDLACRTRSARRDARAASAAALVALVAGLPGPVLARPGTPNDLQIQLQGPTSLVLSFKNTARSGQRVGFEVEQKTNGQRITPAQETALSKRFRIVFNPGRVSAQVDGLAPDTEYCFRVWAREKDTVTAITDRRDETSEAPSGWHCATTVPNAPLAPLNVAVSGTSVTHKVPQVSWKTPDQSNWRNIDEYLIERRDTAGAGQSWALDRRVAGPRGSNPTTPRIDYNEAASIPPRDGRYAYRVCAHNKGGRMCSTPVEVAITVNPAIAGTHAGAVRPGALEVKGNRSSIPVVNANTPGAGAARAAATTPQPPPTTTATPSWTPPAPAPGVTATPARGTWTQQPPAAAAAGTGRSLAPASSLSR